MNKTILFVDDERELLAALEHYFRLRQFRVLCAESAEAARVLITEHSVDLVVSDVAMPGMGGRELLTWVRFNRPELPVILITGVGSIDSAVNAIQHGAFHYVTKPFDPVELEEVCVRAIEYGRLHRGLNGLDMENDCSMVVGSHPAMLQIMHDLNKIAESRVPIMIQGETGTGKTLLARQIHAMEKRKGTPFYTIDCTSLAETLLESELFGHVRGAFTGASASKRGLLEEAQGGTIFLDEIGELSLTTQAKLLHAVQEREIKPVGSNKVVRIDVRFIVATNRDLREEVKNGRFREDLYFRLSVFPVFLLPLRERKDDLHDLIEFFIRRANERYGKMVKRVHPVALRQLMVASWPGNIRELENLIERAVLLAEGRELLAENLGHSLNKDKQSNQPLPLRLVMKDVEREAICQALKEVGGSRTKAAKMLGISRRALYLKMADYNVV